MIKIRAQIGKGGDELMPVFLDGDVLEKQGKNIEAFRQDLFEREYFHRVIGFPKVPELFRFLIDAGKTIALGSSAKTDDLKVYKKAAGIEGLTTVETTSDDAERSKPHPDIFLAALDRLKLSGRQRRRGGRHALRRRGREEGGHADHGLAVRRLLRGVASRCRCGRRLPGSGTPAARAQGGDMTGVLGRDPHGGDPAWQEPELEVN